MLIASLLLAALAASAVGATLVELRRDGFRRIPTDPNRVGDSRPSPRSVRATAHRPARVTRVPATRAASTAQHAR